MKLYSMQLLLAVICFGFQPAPVFSSATVHMLKVENLSKPEGLDVIYPRFSWQIQSGQSEVLQQAYQILVAESPDYLNSDKQLVWNSGKVLSGNSVMIPYSGKKLESEKSYYWKVKVWTNKGETKWSKPAKWTTAFMEKPLSKAQWVGMDSTLNSGKLTTKTKLSARYLRKEFSVETPVKSATLYISGLGMYECYINGIKVSNALFAPTATDYTKRVNYNVYDVRNLITKQQNTVGVILGNGRYFSMRMENVPGGDPLDSPAQVHYGFPKLLLQLEIEYVNGEKECLVSDTSWKINTHGPITANNEFDGEEYDANLELTRWDKSGYDDSNWKFAQKVSAPQGELVAQLNPNIVTMRELKPVSVKEVEKGKFVVDMGQNMVGWLAVKLRGTKNNPVTFRYAETLQKDGSIYTKNLRGARTTNIYTPSADGFFSYEPRFVYHGFRYVEITGLAARPDIHNLTGKVNYDYMENTGTFETSDSTINQIYRNAVWGIMGNYRSFPTDCPQRDERMGWLGDRATGCYGESFIFNNHLLYAKWAQDIMDSQKPNGSLPDVAPAYWQFYSDNITWPSAYIQIVRMLYEQFGDVRAVFTHYNAMKKWLRYMELTYMKEYIITKDQYGDWCMPPESLDIIWSKDPARITDGEILSTSFYYNLLTIMARFADITKHEGDKTEFLALAEKVKTAYNSKFFNPEKAQYGNNTVTANIISLMQGLVPEGYEKKVFDNLTLRVEKEFNSHVSVGLIGIQFLMRGLTAYGRPDLAFKIATNRTYPSWGYMIDNGATTVWELWNGNTADPAMNSGNHVMLLGDLISWFYENLGGIKTDQSETGFKKIIMQPVFPIGLNFVKATHNSPYGLIKSEWKRIQNEIIWDVQIPANTTAEIIVPDAKTSLVSINGKNLNQYTSRNSQKVENALSVNIGSGIYRVSIRQ